ncbi:MAG: hypothetical protein AAF268_05785 [Cyanobacteria bacterium P01_A01_bin.3]
MPLSEAIDLILVPQGAEHQAVVRGLRKSSLKPLPTTVAIPVGPLPVMEYLARLPLALPTVERSLNIVVMGVCGGLSPSVTVGQRVVPDVCVTQFSARQSTDSVPIQQPFDPALCQALKAALLSSDALTGDPTLMVSTDRAVCLATEKHRLQQLTGATIIDMEGAAVLAVLSQRPVSQRLVSQHPVAVAMVRVVSDDCINDLPDLNAALNPDGSLSPLQLTAQMLRHPLRSRHLIVGSLRALRELSAVAEDLGLALQTMNCSTK